MKDYRLLTLLILVLLAASCENTLTGVPPGSSETWAISDYQFEQKITCFCAEPAGAFHRLTVSQDSILAVDGRRPTEVELQSFKTIKQLFVLVESIDPDSVAVLEVEYDRQYGFPSNLYIDRSGLIIDEEIRYQSRNLEQFEN